MDTDNEGQHQEFRDLENHLPHDGAAAYLKNNGSTFPILSFLSVFICVHPWLSSTWYLILSI